MAEAEVSPADRAAEASPADNLEDRVVLAEDGKEL